MRVIAKVQIVGKVQKPWTDSNGVERSSYSANIMQENGQIIDTLRLNQEQYNMVEANKPYTIIADYGSGKNGSYIRVVDILADKA